MGSLNAAGTAAGRITLGPTDRNTGGWGGVRIVSPDLSRLQWVTITGGDANIEGNDIGGALYVNNASADVSLENCTITGNHAVGVGGAIGVTDGALTMTKCVVYGNSCEGNGGAVANLGGTLTITNCTFNGNQAIKGLGGTLAIDRGTGSPTTTIVNSILWGGLPDEIVALDGANSAKYCDVAGGKLPVGITDLGGNISADPVFVAPKAGNFSLDGRSPCIDAGDPKGAPDPDGTVADMGAIYFDQTPSQYLTLPGKTISETTPTFYVNVIGSLIDARSVNFAFLCDPSVATFDSLFATAFDGLADANVQVNVNGDTVFVAMAASVQKSVSDSIIVRMGFRTGQPGSTPLTWLPAFVDIDEELPALTNGGVQVNAYYGDVSLNGTVTALDAAGILQYVVHVIFSIDIDRGDVTGNGKITAFDAALVLCSIVNPGYVYPVQGGALIKPAVGDGPELAWVRNGGAWSLVSHSRDGLLSADLTLRLPGDVGIASDGAIATNRDGDIVTVAVARADGGSELLRLDGLSAAPEILSAFVNEQEALVSHPAAFALNQNAPNPFNPSTTISFSLPEAGTATLGIYSVNGQLVRTLVDDELSAGTHEIVWNGLDASGRDAASGVYLYRLAWHGVSETTTSATSVRRLVLAR